MFVPDEFLSAMIVAILDAGVSFNAAILHKRPA
jgi:hypothetical protein